MSKITNISIVVAAALMLPVLCSCNARKKNTAAARQYTAFITKYNIYYNGDKHYDETLEDMERTYEDDFTRPLPLHPAEARADQTMTQPQGDFTRSIEKAQKAIQLRSITKKPAKKAGKASDPAYKAWMKREEYNPFLHNAWLMMGRSQYMNGDFAGAASTFFYTSRRFGWLPATVTEARLWQARSYLAMDWLFEAEQILSRIKQDQLTDTTLRQLYNMDWAEYYLRSHDEKSALPFLEQAAAKASGAQKTRLRYLLGQTYASTGDHANAYKAFAKVAGSATAPYRTRFNARIRQSEVYQGGDIDKEVAALKRMARYDRNKEYLDQVYYAIGNLYLGRGDTARAISSYITAIDRSTRDGIDKAIAAVRLGSLYYDRGEYDLAQPRYSQGVGQLPATYPGLDSIKRRSDVLDELAVYAQNVTLQDSLLRLSLMSQPQQMAIINKIIGDLKKKEKEEAETAAREAYLADQAARGTGLNDTGQRPATFNINSDGSWYFYNDATRNAGRTEFQRRWGSRRLEDDWRRRNKAAFDTGDWDNGTADGDSPTGDDAGANPDQTPADREAQMRADDPHFPEYYLKQIPKDEDQRNTARDIIQEGLYNQGIILKDKLEDFDAALAILDRLDTQYPDNIYRLDAYYNIYLMFERMGKKQQASRYRRLILDQFADSPYGMALRDPAYLDNLRNMDRDQNERYQGAFDAYMANDNATVHRSLRDMEERYPMSPLMPKFMFLDALAHVSQGDAGQFNATLRTLLERYPDTDITPIATAWLKGMAQGRQLNAGLAAGNLRGMIWDIALTGDSAAADADAAQIDFRLDPADKQILLFVFDTSQTAPNALLFEIARHNFNSFVVQDFDLETMNFGRLGMIAVKDFDNMEQLNHYRRVMARSRTFTLPAGVRPVVISTHNFQELLKSGASLDTYFKYLEAREYHDAQAGLLPYREIEELPSECPGAVPDDTTGGVPEPIPGPTQEPRSIPAAPQTPAANPAVPAAKPVPAQVTPPAPRPAYEPGSEGDDPLLD